MLEGTAQVVLLVPEALLIALLLCAYWPLGAPPLIGLAVTLLIISFITRLLALIAAVSKVGSVMTTDAVAVHPWSSVTVTV